MIRIIYRWVYVSGMTLFFALPTHAAPIQISSGTGFFVSYSGHIVTNEHVVRGCREVTVRGAVPEMQGRVLTLDAQNDLALVQVQKVPNKIAYISTSPFGVKNDDPVWVMGYPREHGMTGQYSIVKSQITSIEGSDKNLPDKVFFKNAADHGNSGGPLLDASGNVVGVVVAKVQQYMVDPQTHAQKLVGEADAAINLPVLMRFLDRERVSYQRWPYAVRYAGETVENNAKNYIVNIHCTNGGK